MVTITTPTELQKALEAHETEILITGEMVNVFRRHKKARTVLIIISVALLALGVFTAPLTEGYSMIAGAIGIVMCIGTFAFKGLPFAVPFALRTAGAKNAMKLLKNGKAWINEDGTLSARLEYKEL